MKVVLPEQFNCFRIRVQHLPVHYLLVYCTGTVPISYSTPPFTRKNPIKKMIQKMYGKKLYNCFLLQIVTHFSCFYRTLRFLLYRKV